MRCAVCGKNKNLDNAHIKPRSEFGDNEDDTHRNIIKMCKNHHDMFDDGEIGICPDRENFVLMNDGEIVTEEPKNPIGHIKHEYVEFKNESTEYKIRLALGMIGNQPWNNVCTN